MEHTCCCLEKTKRLQLLALPSLGEHLESTLLQAKVFVQQDTGMQLVEGQVLAPAPPGLPTALAHTAFHPAFGLLVGPRVKSTSSDSCVPMAGTAGTARLSRTRTRRRCIIRMGKVGPSLLLPLRCEGPQPCGWAGTWTITAWRCCGFQGEVL